MILLWCTMRFWLSLPHLLSQHGPAVWTTGRPLIHWEHSCWLWLKKNIMHLCCSCSSSRLLAKPGCSLAEAWCGRPCDTLGHAWLHSQGLYLHLLASSVNPKQWMVARNYRRWEIRAKPKWIFCVWLCPWLKKIEMGFFFPETYVFSLELYKQWSRIWPDYKPNTKRPTEHKSNALSAIESRDTT